MSETHQRSIAKAVSWRLFGTIGTCLIVWVMSGEIKLAAQVGIIDTVFKIIAYFLHERFWLKIPFGKRRPPEFQI